MRNFSPFYLYYVLCSIYCFSGVLECWFSLFWEIWERRDWIRNRWSVWDTTLFLEREPCVLIRNPQMGICDPRNTELTMFQQQEQIKGIQSSWKDCQSEYNTSENQLDEIAITVKWIYRTEKRLYNACGRCGYARWVCAVVCGWLQEQRLLHREDILGLPVINIRYVPFDKNTFNALVQQTMKHCRIYYLECSNLTADAGNVCYRWPQHHRDTDLLWEGWTYITRLFGV